MNKDLQQKNRLAYYAKRYSTKRLESLANILSYIVVAGIVTLLIVNLI